MLNCVFPLLCVILSEYTVCGGTVHSVFLTSDNMCFENGIFLSSFRVEYPITKYGILKYEIQWECKVGVLK